MKWALLITLSLYSGSIWAAKTEVRCGSSRNKAFPFTVVIKENHKRHIMTLARGKKVLLRTPAKKLSFKSGQYETQYSSGPSFNLSLNSQGKGSADGYLRAKYMNQDGTNLVAGTLTCQKI